MKARAIQTIVITTLVVGIVAQSGFAQGLLGKRHIGFGISMTNPGNGTLSNFDNSIFGFGGGLNIPITSNIDAGFNLSHSEISGKYLGLTLEGSNTSYLGNALYHFRPDQKIDPYIGFQAGIVSMDAKIENVFGFGTSNRENEFAFIINNGLEIDLSESLAVSPSIGYQRIDDFDDFLAHLGLSLWFTELLFGTLSATYAFDEGDFKYSAGFGFPF